MVTKIADKLYKATISGYELEIRTNDTQRIIHIIGGSHYLIDDVLHKNLQSAINMLS